MTFSEWLNRTSMTSFRSMVISVVTSIVVVYFSVISGILLLDKESARAKLNADDGIRASAQTSESSHHSYGMQLATAILTLLGAAIGVNALSQFGDRKTAKELIEAQERGRVGGVAAAAAAAKLVEDAKPKNGNGELGSEQPATQHIRAENAEITQVVSNIERREKPTGDARVDDESGS